MWQLGAASYYTVDATDPDSDPIFTPVPPFAVSFLYNTRTNGFQVLPQPAGYVVSAFANNDAGVVVGTAQVDPFSSATAGFILDASGYSFFEHPGFNQTQPRAIGSTGLVTGFASNDGDPDMWVGFIYDPASHTFTDITFPDGFFVFAQGINANGEIVGSVNFFSANSAYQGSPPGRYGYLREPDGSITLFRVNGLPTAPRGINDAGLITGFVSVNGVPKGFVAACLGAPATRR